MSAVELYQAESEGQMALGLKFNRTDISLAELLQVWQPLCDDEAIHKMYGLNNHAPCRGCLHNCCNTPYVIPDLISFKKTARYYHLDYPVFIANFFQPAKVAAGILKIQSDPCVFLQDNICAIYPIRSLICRFYLCSFLLGDTEQLVYSLAWTGSAATQVFAEKNGFSNESAGQGVTGFDLLFRRLISDYRYEPVLDLFLQADSYDDIPLEPFLKLVPSFTANNPAKRL